MENIQKYYENTENALPHSITEEFINMNIKPSNAIDLGCGTGRDAVYLIKNEWKVLAIDRENTEKIISSKLNEKEIKKFRFSCQNFENVELENNNLLVANFSIPFCNKNCLSSLWDNITESIQKERIFCWEFFWCK